MRKSNIMAYTNNLLTFFKPAYYVKFIFSTNCISPVFHLDCTTWCRYTFLTHFGNKSHCCWRGNFITQVILFIHMTDGVKGMLVSVILQHSTCMLNLVKPKIIKYCLCQITLYWKLSHKFEKWCKFSGWVKAKLHKTRYACIHGPA